MVTYSVNLDSTQHSEESFVGSRPGLLIELCEVCLKSCIFSCLFSDKYFIFGVVIFLYVRIYCFSKLLIKVT